VTSSPETDDRTLLRAHVDGDPDAFGEIVRRHQDRLWAVALRTTGNPEDAADALQDALVAAFRRAASFRGDAQVTTWLHRIVVNSCLDLLRRRTAKATRPLPVEDDRMPELTDRSGPADLAQVTERRADVIAALAQLGEEQRAALVLVDMEGYSVEEAAAILDCPAGTVKSRCSRGRARLVPLLSQYAGNPTGAADVQPRSRAPESEESPRREAQREPD
jgi:RNA polymerase sigma-70 factor (ECF subfamily)